MRFNISEFPQFVNAMNITKAQKRKLQMLFGFCKKLNLSGFKEKTVLNSVPKSGEYFKSFLANYADEKFVVCFLDTANRVIDCKILFSGSINSCIVEMRPIIQQCLNLNANSVIISHNHPNGGSLQPSICDLDLTNRIKSALQTVGIKLLDHIIVADGNGNGPGYLSLLEGGLL